MAKAKKNTESVNESAPVVEQAATDEITIAGAVFIVPNRYFEGHVLTAGEASALNQTFHENVRNNMAKTVKAGGEHDELQAKVSAYAAEYVFNVRGAGGPRLPADPVMAEAIRMVRDKLKAKLKATGQTASAEEINEAARKIASDESRGFLAAARSVVEARKATLDLDI